MVGLHAMCCGLPALLILMSALLGATSGLALLAQWSGPLHHLIHGHEVYVLAASGLLVAVGGALEFRARARTAGFPWLFAVSAACFVANVAIVAAHNFLA